MPVLYLKAFTTTGDENGLLYGTDLDTGRQWQSVPSALAYENDYNSVDGEIRSDTFEDVLADVEGKTASSWHRMIKEKQFPDDHDGAGAVLNLLALQETRTKPNRKALFDLYEAGYQRLHQLMVATPEIFARQVEEAKASGVDIPELPEGATLEDIRQKCLDGSIVMTAHIPNGFYIDRMFEHATLMLDLFAKRRWQVFDFSACGVEIITSDDPVSICWTRKMFPIHSPGFGMRNTLVLVPLSPNLVLFGSFEVLPAELRVTKEFAMRLNEITVKHSHRFLFSRSSDISFENNGYKHVSKSVTEEVEYRSKSNCRSTEKSFVDTFGPGIVLRDERDPNYIDLRELLTEKE